MLPKGGGEVRATPAPPLLAGKCGCLHGRPSATADVNIWRWLEFLEDPTRPSRPQVHPGGATARAGSAIHATSRPAFSFRHPPAPLRAARRGVSPRSWI